MKKIFLLFSCLIVTIAIFANDNITTRDPFQKQTLLPTVKQETDGTLSLDFNNIAVPEVLQLIVNYSGKNLVITDDVKGSLTLHLHRVTWQQALDTILLTQNLVLREQQNVLFISSKTSLQNVVATDTAKLIKVHYAKATDLATLLKNSENGLLSATGSVSADARTNSLWLRDAPARVAMALNYIQRLDVPLKQVLIKARIVNVDENCLQELGVKFGTVNTGSPLSLDGLGMDIPVSMPQNGRFNIAIAKLGPNTLLDLELSALESEGHGKIISSPELITADRTAAYIEAGEEVPYQEKTSSGATNVTFKKAVLSLKVIPQITPQNHILLNLTVNQDKVSSVTVNGVPAIQTREVQTQVAVHDGQTLVLGGIYEQTDSNTVERIPFLGSLPIVGNFFSNKVLKSERRELLVFVTPQVLPS